MSSPFERGFFPPPTGGGGAPGPGNNTGFYHNPEMEAAEMMFLQQQQQQLQSYHQQQQQQQYYGLPSAPSQSSSYPSFPPLSRPSPDSPSSSFPIKPEPQHHPYGMVSAPPPQLHRGPPQQQQQQQQSPRPRLPPGLDIRRAVPGLPPGLSVQRAPSHPSSDPSSSLRQLQGLNVQRVPQQQPPRPRVQQPQLPPAVSRLKAISGISISSAPGSNSSSDNREFSSKLTHLSTQGRSAGQVNPQLEKLSQLNLSISGPGTAANRPARPTPPPPPPQQQQHHVPSPPPPAEPTSTGGVKSYKPLVKHFNRDDPNFGFDLTRVKTEPGLAASSSFTSLMRSSSPPLTIAKNVPTPPPLYNRVVQEETKSSSTINLATSSSKFARENDSGKLNSRTSITRVPHSDASDSESSMSTASESNRNSSSSTQPSSAVRLLNGNNTISITAVTNDSDDDDEDESPSPPASLPPSQTQQLLNHESADSKTTATSAAAESTEGSKPSDESVNSIDEEKAKEPEPVKEAESDGFTKETTKEDQDEMELEESLHKEGDAEGEEHDDVFEEEEDFREDEEGLASGMDEDGAPTEAAAAVNEGNSPFKKPPGGGGGSIRSRHRSSNSHASSDCSESSSSRGAFASSSVAEVQQQREQLLCYYRKPMVGRDTVCIFCLTRCADKGPKLLACLHSACESCFKEQLEAARPVASIDVDAEDDSIPVKADICVNCPLCKVTTAEAEAVDNLFLHTFTCDEGGDDHEVQLCNSCEENNLAKSYCSECKEHLCEDCAKAHQRVRITKDHNVTDIVVPRPKTATSGGQNKNATASEEPKLNCDEHRGERLMLFCESCDVLICRACRLSSHLEHKTRLSHEVAPDVKVSLGQSLADIKIKRNLLDENREMLGAKLGELNIKERSLMRQIADVKSYMIQRVESRFKELANEVSKSVRQKRKVIEERKSNLDRFYVQTDYALAFAEHGLHNSEDDKALLVAKRTMERQMRRLKKVDASSGLSGDQAFRMDLYFQHFSGQQMHASMESVLSQVMTDVKILSAPPPVPDDQQRQQQPQQQQQVFPPTAPSPVPQRDFKPNVTPVTTPVKMQSAAARGSPLGNSSRGGTRSPQVTPQKLTRGNLVRGSPRGSPVRGGLTRGSLGRGGVSSRGAISRGPRGGRGGSTVRGSSSLRGSSSVRGGGSVRGNGGPVMPGLVRGVGNRGGGGGRGGGSVTPIKTNAMASRGRPPGLAQQPQQPVASNRGGRGGGRGGATIQQQIMKQQTMTNSKPNPPPGTSMMPQHSSSGAVDPYYMAAYGKMQQQQPQQPPQRQMQQHPMQQHSAQQMQQHQAQQQQMQRQQMQHHQSLQQHPGPSGPQQHPSLQQHPGMQLQQGHPPNQQMLQQQRRLQQQQQDFRHPQYHMQQQQQQPGGPVPVPSGSPSWHQPQLGPGGGGGNQSSQQQSSSGQPMRNQSDNSFKITLPGRQQQQQQPQQPQKRESTDNPEIIDLDFDDDGAPLLPRDTSAEAQVSATSAPGSIFGSGIYNTKTDTGPSVESQPPPPPPRKNSSLVPDLSSLIDDDDIGGSPADWMAEGLTQEIDPLKTEPYSSIQQQQQQPPAKPPMVTINPDALFKDSPDHHNTSSDCEISLGSVSQPKSVKMELAVGSKKRSSGSKSGLVRHAAKAQQQQKDDTRQQETKTPEMEGNSEADAAGQTLGDDEWCAVCHDGGDTLYCCDRCPKVYHLFCYIPPLKSEPPDDWVCLMCATTEEIWQFSNKKPKSAKLGERDHKICRRILFDLYNQYPESYAFRDCSDLNFPEYRDKVKEPIALDIIKERLDQDNPEQYSSIVEFLRDVRKMFKNCFKFHDKNSEYFLQAKSLEEKLDRQLEKWLPDLAYDQNLGDDTPSRKSNNNTAAKRANSPVAGPSKRRRKHSDSDPKKKKKISSVLRDQYEFDSSMSESEQLDVLDAMEASMEEKRRSSENEHKKSFDDDDDGDYRPSAVGGASSKGKGKARPKRHQ